MTSRIREHRGARTVGGDSEPYLPPVPFTMPESGWDEWLHRIARTVNSLIFAGSGIATATLAALGAGPLLNYVDNSGFSINQRGYVSGTALAAGVYGHDRWKAGAGGVTYTFTPSVPATTVAIAAGTLQQVVEGASLVGGNYVLSWTGTAQGRVGAGSYAVSPVAVAGIAAGANTTIEFNTGTLGQVKLTAGKVAVSWSPLPVQQELARCQRFYVAVVFNHLAYTTAGTAFGTTMVWPVTMRATPTVAFSGVVYSNASGIASALTAASGLIYAVGAAAAGAQFSGTALLSADL